MKLVDCRTFWREIYRCLSHRLNLSLAPPDYEGMISFLPWWEQGLKNPFMGKCVLLKMPVNCSFVGIALFGDIGSYNSLFVAVVFIHVLLCIRDPTPYQV